ncbi:MAG: DUF2243 domain-containing protein [Chloroflexaceae bacterium]|nr:DUF2243 domain-containing protein [Chloroflexaceae bacterium]
MTLQEKHQTETEPNRRPLIVAGVILGLGQGGFFDGIVFHQLLQWHHLFSSVETDMTLAGLEVNTLGDGLFHLLNWGLTLLGIFLLWQACRQENRSLSTRTFLGSLILGAGLFNLIEGIINHHLLAIHHVKAGSSQLAFDLGFLGAGLLLAVVGWLLVKSEPAQISS